MNETNASLASIIASIEPGQVCRCQVSVPDIVAASVEVEDLRRDNIHDIDLDPLSLLCSGLGRYYERIQRDHTGNPSSSTADNATVSFFLDVRRNLRRDQTIEEAVRTAQESPTRWSAAKLRQYANAQLHETINGVLSLFTRNGALWFMIVDPQVVAAVRELEPH